MITLRVSYNMKAFAFIVEPLCGSFPLHRTGGLTRYVVNYAVNVINLVDDSV